jgi:hypothetical protein
MTLEALETQLEALLDKFPTVEDEYSRREYTKG